VTDIAGRSDLRATIVEIFDVFAGVNERLTVPFDLGRIKVALVCHFLFSEDGHLCNEASGCSNAVDAYYERIVPTDSNPGRVERIDRLFTRILRADEAREHIGRLDYRAH
jgi:hypothetical protein